jgi:hypothetical protein
VLVGFIGAAQPTGAEGSNDEGDEEEGSAGAQPDESGGDEEGSGEEAAEEGDEDGRSDDDDDQATLSQRARRRKLCLSVLPLVHLAMIGRRTAVPSYKLLRALIEWIYVRSAGRKTKQPALAAHRHHTPAFSLIVLNDIKPTDH